MRATKPLKEETMAETPEEKVAREAEAAKVAEAKRVEDEKAADAALLEDDDFDKERAMKTIHAQREVERKQKEELKELRAIKATRDEEAEAKANADRTAEEKLAKSEAAQQVLRDELDAEKVRADFERQALSEEIGIDPEDLELAYLAAKEQGLLGTRDPDTGLVEGHDFDTLAEKYPALLGGGGTSQGRTGDAGRKTTGKKNSVGAQFNKTVYDALRR